MKSNLFAKNKKAMLMSVTLRIIIAVMCLIVLIYLAVSLYGIITKKTRLEQGRATLNEIIDRINYMEKNNIDLDDKIILLSPKKWYLLYNQYPYYRKTPGENTELCICETVDFNECSSKRTGSCEELEQNVVITSNIRETEKSLKSPFAWFSKLNAIKIYSGKKPDNLLITKKQDTFELSVLKNEGEQK